MHIEKLNENKIRIFLNTEDLKAKNIDVHTLMSNSIESQDLFIDMLSIAEAQVGFKTNNYKLVIEALASSEGNFIFTITRVKPDEANGVKLKVKRQSVLPNKLLSIYKFNTFDNFCEFCNCINASAFNKLIKKLNNSTLFLYKNQYYLILRNLKLSLADFKSFTYMISEFALCIKGECLQERKIQEYGKVIIPKNAINTCLKYFK